MTAYGTRVTPRGLRRIRVAQGHQTRYLLSDPGMTRFVRASFTFTASDGRVTGANESFPITTSPGNFTLFRDEILIEGTNLNNGYFTPVARDGTNHAWLQLDPPPKDEGPVVCTLRTP